MGTGKTTVGRELAARSGRTFVDLDEEIVKVHGPIADVFAEGGEDLFRELEREAVAKVSPQRNLVIATGGGTLLDEDNVVALLGSEIYTLTASPTAIAERITAEGISSRPLLAEADDIDEEIQRLLDERKGVYERFPTIDTTNKSIDEIVTSIGDAGADISAPVSSSALAATGRDSREIVLYGIIALLTVLAIAIFIVLLSF